MALFDPTKISAQNAPAEEGEPEPAPDGKRMAPESHRETRRYRRDVTASAIKRATARRLVGELQEDEVLHLVGANSWNTQDLLEVLLDYTGPAGLHMAVYSISDNAARTLVRLQGAGLITRLVCLINHHMARTRPAVTAQMHQIADAISVYPCHAKVYVLRGAERAVCVYSSANLTACPWLEASTITPGMEFADWTIGWIQRAMTFAEPFTGESMSRSVRRDVETDNERFGKR